jgi:hypothetical protein
MQAHICYKDRLLTLQYKGTTVCRELGPPPGPKSEISHDMSSNRLTLPARAEVIVQLPVTEESPAKEGLVERTQFLEGVYLADGEG